MGPTKCHVAYLTNAGTGPPRGGEQGAQLLPCFAQRTGAVAKSGRCRECPSVQRVDTELYKALCSWETTVFTAKGQQTALLYLGVRDVHPLLLWIFFNDT